MDKPSIMITEATRPAALAAARRVADLPERFSAEAKAIQARFQAEMDALKAEHDRLHEAHWAELIAALDLDPDKEWSLCQDHLKDHSICFISEVDPAQEEDQGVGGLLARLIAARQGGDGPGIVRLN